MSSKIWLLLGSLGVLWTNSLFIFLGYGEFSSMLYDRLWLFRNYNVIMTFRWQEILSIICCIIYVGDQVKVSFHIINTIVVSIMFKTKSIAYHITIKNYLLSTASLPSLMQMTPPYSFVGCHHNVHLLLYPNPCFIFHHFTFSVTSISNVSMSIFIDDRYGSIDYCKVKSWHQVLSSVYSMLLYGWKQV